MAEFAPFVPAAVSTKRLYTRDGLAAHRRTLSSNTGQYQAFADSRGHRRTLSNSTADFQTLLAASPSADKQSKLRVSPNSIGEEDDKKQRTVKRGKRGFIGTLDAAIVYFGEGQRSYSTLVAGAGGEAAQLRAEMEQLQVQIEHLERRNDSLKTANELLTAQREVVSLAIGSLNTKILDLELLLKERKSPVPLLALPSRPLPKPTVPFGQRPTEGTRFDTGIFADKGYRPTDSQATRPSRTEDNSKEEIDSF